MQGRSIAIISLLFLAPLLLMAQEERGLTRDGNKQFDKGKYADAEAAYKKALEKKNNFSEAIFNLGDAMYKQGRYDDAIKQFELAAKMITDTMQRAQAHHNLGNCHLEKQEWENAVSDYKKALRLNPRDKDTKYNLAYANEKLKQDQQQQQNKQNQKQQNKDNKDNKDQKDKKDGKGDKDKQDQKDKQNKDGQGNKDEQKDQKQKKGNRQELSKEQAEKLLEALKAEEQKAQEKMQKKTAKPVDVKIEKDW